MLHIKTDLLARVAENPTEAGKEGRGVLRWDDARFERPGEPPLRIDSIEFRWRFHSGDPSIIRAKHQADAIVRDAIARTLLFVDLDGTVSGDVEEELGRRS